MNYWITIAKEAVTLTGYRTYENIETLPREEALKELAGAEIVRRFASPFDHTIEIVIIKEVA